MTAEPPSLVADLSVPRRDAPVEGVAGADSRLRLGRLPLLTLATACGVALVSVSYALSRSGGAHAEPLFWLGLLGIFLPILVRLASSEAPRNERVALVVLLGAALYLVKVLRDPFAFTYGDELIHQHNVLQILHSQALFGSNPILPVTPSYPGLEAVTATLTSAGGMSTFAAGLIVVGVARIILMLAFFLLYEEITKSVRVAGLATAFYAASPHFLFFIADFSYESLALPFAILAMLAVVRARSQFSAVRPGWGIVAIAAILAVVVTHHMTSYALVALLVALCLMPPTWWPARRWPWVFAATAVAATAAWLFFVASNTVGYLSPVITHAISDTFRTAAGESTTRDLFSSPTGQVAPTWEHVVGVGAAVVVVAALPIGLRALWRDYGKQPVAVLLGCASVAYVGTLGARLVPAAWETAVRASEFLFIGVALVLALAVLEGQHWKRLDWLWVWAPGVARIVGLAAAAVLLAGGIVSTTTQAGRLAEPYRLAVAGVDINPPGVAVARWARDVLGPGQRIAAEDADARFLLVYGREHVFTSTNPPIRTILQTPKLYRWQLDTLRQHRIRYVVIDASRASQDVSTGFYFPRQALGPEDRYPDAAMTKFERAGAQRIYDGGNIIVDDLQGVNYAAAAP